MKKMSMGGPLGVLLVDLTVATTKDVEDVDGRPPGCAIGNPVVATTEDVEDIDGRPPRGCYKYSRLWPPPM
jgi:hypothetical protein